MDHPGHDDTAGTGLLLRGTTALEQTRLVRARYWASWFAAWGVLVVMSLMASRSGRTPMVAR